MDSQPGDGPSKFFIKETDKWLKDNVEGSQGRFDAADAAKAARDAEIAADQVLDADEVKGMSDADIQARIKEINKRIPATHLVMHGSSSVPQDWLKIINEFGGEIPETYGVPVDQN